MRLGLPVFVLVLALVLVLVLVPVSVLLAVKLALAGLMFAKLRLAIVGNAALGSMGQKDPVDAGQDGVGNVDGAFSAMVTEAHWLLKAL